MHIPVPVNVVAEYLTRPSEQQAEKRIVTDQLTTKKKTRDLRICTSTLDLPTSDYKIYEEILAKAHHDDNKTIRKAEIEPFIIVQQSHSTIKNRTLSGYLHLAKVIFAH